MAQALRIGVVSDGKAGHMNQSLGLAEALRRLRPETQIHELPALSRWAALRILIGGSADAPTLDLLVGAGHGTHLTLLALGYACACPTVVIMRPSLPRQLFDLCITPRHDGLPEDERRWLSDGPMNRLLPGPKGEEGLILIGGPSPHFAWDEEAVLAQLRHICAEGRWQLSTSRRTPPSFLAALRGQQQANLVIHDVADLPPGWLGASLAQAPRCWVTPDSASMVYEALTAGCGVGLLELAPQAGSRVAGAMADLGDRGLVRTFGDWVAGDGLVAVEPRLAEADRLARRLLDSRWLA